LFIKYLQHLNQWEDGKHHYEFGTPTSNAKAKTTSDDSFESLSYTPSALYNPALAFHTNVKYLWSPAQKSAVEYGNLLHLLMSRLQTKAHLEMHLDDLVSEGRIGLDYVNNLAEDARKILEDARLKDYYTPSCTAYNERSIVTPSGDTLRPDRIVITAPDDAVLIDYKTGRPNASHRDQMMQYEQVMRDMGFLRVKKILVYIGDTISVKEV
jgi:hypothetical protein